MQVWLLLIPTSGSKATASLCLDRQQGEQTKADRIMRVSRVATLALLSMQLGFLAQTGGRLAGKGLVAEEDPSGAANARRVLDSFPERSREAEAGKPHLIRFQKAAEDRAGGGTQSKPSNKQRLETSKQKAGGKRKMPQLSPPKTKSQAFQTHLEGHGKFNTDTYSCPGIQSKACRKPSDCDGCLGLYTCKLPRGKCDLKAVSRQTAGFSQST